MWHVARDMLHVTGDMLHMTRDMWQVEGGKPALKFQLPNSYGLGVGGVMWHLTCDTWHMTPDMWHMTQFI